MTPLDWTAVKRELATNAQTRAMCGGITRATLLAWRDKKAFPAPVVKISAGGNTIELWARAQVREWLARRDPRLPRRFTRSG